MTTTPILPGLESLVKPFRFLATPHEFKVTPLKECPTPESLLVCDTPDKAADYWRMHVATNPHFDPECECLAVLLLNTRRRVKGHQLVSIGIQDTILVSPASIYRLAVVTAAHSIIVMHNHPRGKAPLAKPTSASPATSSAPGNCSKSNCSTMSSSAREIARRFAAWDISVVRECRALGTIPLNMEGLLLFFMNTGLSGILGRTFSRKRQCGLLKERNPANALFGQ